MTCYQISFYHCIALPQFAYPFTYLRTSQLLTALGAIMNKADVNICVQVFCEHIFNSLGKIPSSMIAGSYVKPMLTFIKNRQAVFQVVIPCAFPPAVNKGSCCAHILVSICGVKCFGL